MAKGARCEYIIYMRLLVRARVFGFVLYVYVCMCECDSNLELELWCVRVCVM